MLTFGWKVKPDLLWLLNKSPNYICRHSVCFFLIFQKYLAKLLVSRKQHIEHFSQHFHVSCWCQFLKRRISQKAIYSSLDA